MENEIAEGVYWVGAHFPDPAPGVSVNSYLIKDEKTMVIDTGMPVVASHFVANIRALVDPKTIDYIVITHADVDHIGGLTALLEEAPQAVVVASPYESRGLGCWGLDPEIRTVEDGETMSLGRRTVKFVSAPYTCKPGTIMVFEKEDGILFSADLYAAMGPSRWTLFSEGDLSTMLKGVQGIKLGNTRHTSAALMAAKSLPVKIIAPGHGTIINDRIGEYTDMLLAEIK